MIVRSAFTPPAALRKDVYATLPIGTAICATASFWTGSSVDMRLRPGVAVEAGDVRSVRVDLRRAVRHPLRHRPPDPGSLLHPHRGHRPQAPDLRTLPKERHTVRGQGQQSVDRVLDAH